MYLKDNADLFAEYDAEQEEERKRLPECDECEEEITDEYLYDIDGVLYCEECMKKLFKKPVENYLK